MARMSPITVRRTYGRIASHDLQSRRRGSDTALPILGRTGQAPARTDSLAPLPGPYQTQLVCGVSTQLHQQVTDWDELIQPGDADFPSSGLHRALIIRLSYVHATDPTEFAGAIGQVDVGCPLPDDPLEPCRPAKIRGRESFLGSSFELRIASALSIVKKTTPALLSRPGGSLLCAHFHPARMVK